MKSVFLCCASLAVLGGCAELPQIASKPVLQFPTREDLATLPARQAPSAVFGTKDVVVSDWRVESPPLPTIAAYDDSSPWGALLRELTSAHTDAVSLSPAMHCAAAEIGRFHLKHLALPAESLRRFIVARCGGDTPMFSPVYWAMAASPGLTEDQIVAAARESVGAAIEAALAHGHHVVGLAAVRDAKFVSVVLAIGTDDARLDPGARVADANHRVTVRGVVRDEYSAIGALVNRGDLGVAPCDSSPGVRLPHFEVTCELAPGDAYAWVQVIGQRPGRVLQFSLADTLVYDGDPSAATYHGRSYGARAPLTTVGAFTEVLLDRINTVRKRAGATPLTLAAKQSLENERLAGTLLDAAMTRNDDAAEKATLGLMAGWEVEGGTIRNGQFLLGAVAPINDATAWLDFALERPTGRSTLLAPDARALAIGATIAEGGRGVGAAATTYSFFESDDHSADEALFLRRITDARASLHLSAPLRFAAPDAVRTFAGRVLSNRITPKTALDYMLASVAGASAAGVHGYVFETNDLANLAIPDVFLKPGSLPLVLTVTHHRAPGAAWGQYVIFALLPDLEQGDPRTQTAEVAHRRRASAARPSL